MKKTLLMQGFFLIYAMQYVKVIINKKVKSLDHDFVYEVPPEWMGLVQIGSVVSVPFGQRTEKGIVVGYAEPSEEYHIKYIDGILNEEFLFPEDLIVLADLLSRYYMNTTIGMLKAMIPRGINLFGRAQKQKTEPWQKIKTETNSRPCWNISPKEIN